MYGLYIERAVYRAVHIPVRPPAPRRATGTRAGPLRGVGEIFIGAIRRTVRLVVDVNIGAEGSERGALESTDSAAAMAALTCAMFGRLPTCPYRQRLC